MFDEKAKLAKLSENTEAGPAIMQFTGFQRT